MESLWWALRTWDPFCYFWPFAKRVFFLFLFGQSDFILLLMLWYWRLLGLRLRRRKAISRGPVPSGLVIIPSLLRNREDFNAITVTVDSCAHNGYPGELSIVASVDGNTEKPELYRELCEWVGSRSYPENVHTYVGGTPTRLGKMMAVHAGVELMKILVARGLHPSFPAIYFSVDGDGTLGARALELIARRLVLPHRFSKNPRRLVSGKIYIRPDLFWRGSTLDSLRSLFTIQGQIYLQVAREFLFANVSRFNLKLMPKVGVGGALYGCWSEILLNGPAFMGHMRSLRPRDWARWWLGLGPPAFSRSEPEPLPEALTGPSDDTAVSFLAAMSSWRDGVLSMEPPRTPLHAFGRLVKAYFLERSPDYEPEARVFTFTPTTLKTLWVQRVRWNASWVECAHRFKRAFYFHWELGGIVALRSSLFLWNLMLAVFFYVALPFELLTSTHSVITAFAISYAFQVFMLSLFTFFALAIETEWRRFWPVVLALPLAPLYSIGINFFSAAAGTVKDLLLFGNATKFAPEWTLKKGRTERIALLFRARRFFSLCVRAVVAGDVPWGAFWLGWTETPWTPSGYDGWTTERKPRSIVPRVSAWFGRRPQ